MRILFDLQTSVYRTVIHQQGVAHFGYFDARVDEAAFGSTNLKRDICRGQPNLAIAELTLLFARTKKGCDVGAELLSWNLTSISSIVTETVRNFKRFWDPDSQPAAGGRFSGFAAPSGK